MQLQWSTGGGKSACSITTPNMYVLAHPLQGISCTQEQKKTQQSDPIPATDSSTPSTKGSFQDVSARHSRPRRACAPRRRGAPFKAFSRSSDAAAGYVFGEDIRITNMQNSSPTTVKASRTESSHKCTRVSSHAAMFSFHASDSSDCCACTFPDFAL